MKISVYIPSYNQKEFLIEAIESVLDQTLKPYQIIIVDDCSGDGSQEVIAGYTSRYKNLIIPIYHKMNTGIAQVRIDALHAVSGDYVSFVDGDDRFLPTKLEKESKRLKENPAADIAFSNNYHITVDGKRFRTWIDQETPPEGDVFCQTFGRNYPRGSLFRSELVNYHAWKSIGFHDSSLKLYEDYDMRIRLTKKLKTVYHPEPLSEYRIHEESLSKMEAIHHLKTMEYIFKKNSPLLEDLASTERNRVRNSLNEWIADFAKNAVLQLILKKENYFRNRIHALRYFLWYIKYRKSLFDANLFLRIILPI